MFERDALGREIQRGAGDGRIAIRSGYDAMDRLVDQRVSAPSAMEGVPAALVQRQWQYDRAGRVTRVDDARWGTTVYGYDRIDQLVEAARGANREVFKYDPAGSLVAALEGLGRPDEPWEIAPGNLLKRTKSAKYTYDKRGRRTVKLELGGGGEGRATEYQWDVRDRLREVRLPDGTRVVMGYDALGRRVRKEVVPEGRGGARVTEFVWDGDELAAENDSERGLRVFVHEPGTFVPLLQQERGEVFTYVNDHLGMPKELIDGSGRLAWSAAHSAWGQVVEARADSIGEQNRGRKIDSPFRLLGQVADEETGICWTRFRCFDPEVGRWLSPDPLGFEGGWDLFGFDGSPTLDIDPLGLATRQKDVDALQNGPNGTFVTVGSKAEADELLKAAFPTYQKVRGVGSEDASGPRKKRKMDRFKQGGAYHKDYAIDRATGRVRGHETGNPHGAHPHINIKRTDGVKVEIRIV
jgi:RHS repeat-associated protein